MADPSRLRARLSGLFSSITTRLSPNRSSRRGARVQGVVIHTTEGSFLGALSWMLNNASDISAHYLVSDQDRRGDDPWVTVVQLVPEDEKAWTARSANPVTINYELAGFARRTRDEWLGPYRAQLRTAAALVAEDVVQYDIPLRRGWPGILGHGDLDAAGFPNNHTDPGKGFPWDAFLSLVKSYVEGPLPLDRQPRVVDQPARVRKDCLPAGLRKIPRPAWRLAKWHLAGRKGSRPLGTPRNVSAKWPWYWAWFQCRFFSGGGRHASD